MALSALSTSALQKRFMFVLSRYRETCVHWQQSSFLQIEMYLIDDELIFSGMVWAGTIFCCFVESSADANAIEWNFLLVLVAMSGLKRMLNGIG